MSSSCVRFAPALWLAVTLLGACKGDDGRGGGSAASLAANGGTSAGSTSTGGAESGGGGASSGDQGGGGSKDECQGSGLGNRLCAAFDARQCSEPLDCLTCVTDAREQRRPYEGCAACGLAFDAWYQCAVSAFEAGNVADGVHCADGRAEVHPACGSYLESAIRCSVDAEKGCPETWPP